MFAELADTVGLCVVSQGCVGMATMVVLGAVCVLCVVAGLGCVFMARQGYVLWLARMCACCTPGLCVVVADRDLICFAGWGCVRVSLCVCGQGYVCVSTGLCGWRRLGLFRYVYGRLVSVWQAGRGCVGGRAGAVCVWQAGGVCV